MAASTGGAGILHYLACCLDRHEQLLPL